MKVYTKTGDDGTTSLFSGGRVEKDHPRLEAYGSLDELNSILGLLACEPLPDGCLQWIQAIQGGLFSMGAAIADANRQEAGTCLSMTLGDLERWIDRMDQDLPELKAFIVPGGSRPAALAHVARTICRRSERRVRTLVIQGGGVPDDVQPFLNRLGDFFFVLARFINHVMAIPDPEWRP
ncbi:MAG: cob(I)yrinic acid a,c-diamide adenosyltransferase [Acidobacteria bacterium]|nr:MAG: cob(I)yrinic acid a,c-diamide adenosyltransferase [Acidobacteriota bacterium]